MKMKRSVLAVVLAAAFILGSVLPAMAAPYAKEHHVELEQVGEFSSDEIGISHNAFMSDAGDGSKYVYNIKGSKATEEKIAAINYLENGLYILSKAGAADVNSCALMNEDGEILIPFEHAIYIWPRNFYNDSYKQTRYVIVITGTEQTENEDDALFRTTDSFAELGPREGSTMYKGYGEIYDLQKERFVPDIRLEKVDRYDTVNVVGGSLLIQNEDGGFTLYDENGKKLRDLNSTARSNGLAAVERSQSGSGYSVFDDQGKEVSGGAGTAYVFSSTSGYLFVEEGDQYNVVDIDGKSVVKAPFDGQVNAEDHDVYLVDGGKGNRLIDGTTGEVLADTDKYINNEGYGCYTYETGDNVCAVITPAGLLTEECILLGGFPSDGDNLIALNDGSASMKYDENAYYYNVRNGVFCVEPANGGSPALYDLFTGKLLLDDGFTSAQIAGDRLVVQYRNSSTPTFKIYEINVKDGK